MEDVDKLALAGEGVQTTPRTIDHRRLDRRLSVGIHRLSM